MLATDRRSGKDGHRRTITAKGNDPHVIGLLGAAVRTGSNDKDELYIVMENAPIRPFCVGRRNWHFADTVDGAKASANLYSLLQMLRSANRASGCQQTLLMRFARNSLIC